MAIIFTVLFLTYNIALIIGFFRPEWVLYRFNVKKTTSRVLMIYGSLSLLTILVFITVFYYGEEKRQYVSAPDMEEIEESAKTLPGKGVRITAEDHTETESKESSFDKPENNKKENEPELTASKKQEIISELKKLDRKARTAARKRYPSGPEDLSQGDNFILLKETRFVTEADKTDSKSDGDRTIKLYPGSWINILENREGKSSDMLKVEAFAPDGRSYGKGRITEAELEKQWGSKKLDIEMQKELTKELKDQNRSRILKKYDITETQLNMIESEN